MNVLGISGTPRKNGNSEILLRYALQPFQEQGWQARLFLLSTAVASEPREILGQQKRLRQAQVLGQNVLGAAEKVRPV